MKKLGISFSSEKRTIVEIIPVGTVVAYVPPSVRQVRIVQP